MARSDLSLGPLAAAGSLCAILASCTCDGDRRPAEPEGRPMVWACQEAEGARATIEASGPAAASAEGEALFALELGRPALSSAELFVPYLDHDGRQQRPGVAVAKHALGGLRRIDLGLVHGDASPPQVALDGSDAFVVVSEGATTGEQFRVGMLGEGAGEVRWLGEFAGGADRSPGHDIAAAGGEALVVWDDWDSSDAHAVIRGTRVGPSGGVLRSFRLSPAGVDAEAPRLLVRKDGGYVLAWVAVGESDPPAAGGEVGDEVAAVAVARRWLQLQRLDAQGAVVGGPIDVTPRDGHVVGFDLLRGHGDTVLVALRDDHSTPGIGGGVIRTATVTTGGAVELRSVAEEEIGAGLPALFFDADPKDGAPHGWLSYSGRDGGTRLLPLSPLGTPLELSGTELDLDDRIALAAVSGRLVLVRPRGRNVELVQARCAPGPAPSLPELPASEMME